MFLHITCIIIVSTITFSQLSVQFTAVVALITVSKLETIEPCPEVKNSSTCKFKTAPS